jgi:hypothetical protein
MCDAVAMGVVFPFLKMERDKSPVKKKDMSNVCPLCVTYVKKPVNAVKLKYQCYPVSGTNQHKTSGFKKK